MLADLAKEAMLDRVPFGGSARIMADRDGQLIGVHQFFLESEPPGTATADAGELSFRRFAGPRSDDSV